MGDNNEREAGVKRVWRTAGAAIAIGLLAACGGGGDKEPAATSDPDAPVEESPFDASGELPIGTVAHHLVLDGCLSAPEWVIASGSKGAVGEFVAASCNEDGYGWVTTVPLTDPEDSIVIDKIGGEVKRPGFRDRSVHWVIGSRAGVV